MKIIKKTNQNGECLSIEYKSDNYVLKEDESIVNELSITTREKFHSEDFKKSQKNKSVKKLCDLLFGVVSKGWVQANMSNNNNLKTKWEDYNTLLIDICNDVDSSLGKEWPEAPIDIEFEFLKNKIGG